MLSKAERLTANFISEKLADSYDWLTELQCREERTTSVDDLEQIATCLKEVISAVRFILPNLPYEEDDKDSYIC